MIQNTQPSPIINSSPSVNDSIPSPPLAPRADLNKLFSLIRNNRIDDFKEELAVVQDQAFDPSNIVMSFLENYGTQYKDDYNQVI